MVDHISPNSMCVYLRLIWNTAVGFGPSAILRAFSQLSVYNVKEIINCGMFGTIPLDYLYVEI